jgi:hypothetical protein
MELLARRGILKKTYAGMLQDSIAGRDQETEDQKELLMEAVYTIDQDLDILCDELSEEVGVQPPTGTEPSFNSPSALPNPLVAYPNPSPYPTGMWNVGRPEGSVSDTSSNPILRQRVPAQGLTDVSPILAAPASAASASASISSETGLLLQLVETVRILTTRMTVLERRLAEVNNINTSRNESSKYKDNSLPPVYNSITSYTTWLKELDYWREGSSIPARNQGSKIIERLGGKAKTLALSLPKDEVICSEGVDNIIQVLSGFFKRNSSDAMVNKLTEMMEFHRKGSIKDYIAGFEVLTRQYEELGGEIQNAMALTLFIKNAHLSTTDRALLLKGREGDSLDQVICEAKKIFVIADGDSTGETTLLAEFGQEGDYVQDSALAAHGNINSQGNYRQSATGVGSGAGAGAGKRYLRCHTCGTNDHKFGEAPKCAPALQEILRKGYCSICKKTEGHTFSTCPDRVKRLARSGVKGLAMVGVRGEISREIALLAATGLEALEEESAATGCGVLDVGSSGTVAGERWLGMYQRLVGHNFPQHPARSSYTFGAGKKDVLFQVELPICLGACNFEMRVDIVPGSLPLLISRRSQIAMRSGVDNETGKFTVKVGKVTSVVGMKESCTGHWLVPLG